MPRDYKRVLAWRKPAGRRRAARRGRSTFGVGIRAVVAAWVSHRVHARSPGQKRRRGRSPSASATGARSTCRVPAGAAGAGGALHGLRHPVLPPGLSARQPDSRLERPRLPRPVARGDRPAARDEQLPGVHRPPVSRAVRGRRACSASTTSRSTIKSIEAAIIERAFDEGWIVPRHPRAAHWQEGGRRRLRAGGPRGGRAVEPRRPPGDRLRAGRSHRRAAALRHSRVQAGEARPRPPARR